MKQRTFDLGRAALHFPVGLYVAWLSTVNVVLCVILGVIFLAYEITEDWRIRDRGFLDVCGYLVGLGAGAAAIELIRWLL